MLRKREAKEKHPSLLEYGGSAKTEPPERSAAACDLDLAAFAAVDAVHFVNLAARVASFKLGLKPRPDDFLGQLPGDDPRPERQNLRVVTFARPLRRVGVVRLRGPHPHDLVGGNRHADTGAADEDAPLQTPLGNVLSDAVGDVRVVVFRGVRVVPDGDAAGLEKRLEGLFESSPGFVGTERNKLRCADGLTSRVAVCWNL